MNEYKRNDALNIEYEEMWDDIKRKNAQPKVKHNQLPNDEVDEAFMALYL